MTTPLEKLFALPTGFQNACILGAAAELDLFSAIVAAKNTMSAEELIESLSLDPRGTETLLAALVHLELLVKNGDQYSVPDDFIPYLDFTSKSTLIPIIRHCLCSQRQWCQLAWVVKTGVPAPSHNSMLGPLGDNTSFILGMNSIAQTVITQLVPKLEEANLLSFTHMLDLGGASGSYTEAMLNRNSAKATIFDLPNALQQAAKRFKNSTLSDRVQLYEGDFYKDDLPTGFDFVWVSAIIHQQDNAATEEMFRKIYNALVSGGRIAIRDVYFESDKSGPPAAVYFAVNMLANTPHGKVYTKEEVFELLKSAGFVNARLAIPAQDMSAVIVAEKE